MSDYAGRIARLQARMQTEGAALAVLSAGDNMRFLSGWSEYGHWRLLSLWVPSQGEPTYVLPAMHVEQVRTNPAGLTRIVGWDDGRGWQTAAQKLVAEYEVTTGRVLIDDGLYSMHLLALQALFPGWQCEAAGETMARLREIKTPDELAAMQTAGALIDEIVEQTFGELREGMTEMDVSDLLHAHFKRRGTGPSFTPIVGFGPNAALPHHSSGDAVLQRGDIVLIDAGCLSEGYPSDITRTVAFGEPTDGDARRVYGVVSAAHYAARAAAKPGVSGEQVDAIARKVIADAGYGPQFVHRTGHGIGLSGHEPPYIVEGSVRPLLPGMCFSIEPGIYLPGRFGIRIENIVTMEENGVRSLNADPPQELRVLSV